MGLNLHLYRSRNHWQPKFKKRRVSPGSYLIDQRRELLVSLPEDHRLRERTGATGVLSQTRVPEAVRHAYTDEELRDIKKRRSASSNDPDNAHSYLKRSQLVTMWNADYDQEDQWDEFDEVRPIMGWKRYDSRLPKALFHSEDLIEEKRNRVMLEKEEEWVVPRSSDNNPHWEGNTDHVHDKELEEDITLSVEAKEYHAAEAWNSFLKAQNEKLGTAVTQSSPSEEVLSPPLSPPHSPLSSIASDISSDDDETIKELATLLSDGPPGVEDGNDIEPTQIAFNEPCEGRAIVQMPDISPTDH